MNDLEEHRPLLWAVAYRMTGVAADADDVVQETFARALAHPPARDRPVRPWLVKVAMNVARDLLRKRRRTPYPGVWLPSPVDDEHAAPAAVADDAEQRYSLRESATFAFLLAVERLTPMRRAVLILRDVFDFSTEETADALGISVDATKQNLSRARKALASYDEVREPLDDKAARDEAALARFFTALASGDVAEVQKLLTEDVESRGDGGGLYAAARDVMRGPYKVALVYTNLARLLVQVGASSMSLVRANGGAAALMALDVDPAWADRAAPKTLFAVDTAPDGRIRRVYSQMAPAKLTAL